MTRTLGIAIAAAALVIGQGALAQQANPPAGTDWYGAFGVEKPKPDPKTGEWPVAPYATSDANAGATPFSGHAMADAFGGQQGIRRVVDRALQLYAADPRLSGIFAPVDPVRLHRLLFEQVCYILNAGCHYTGRTMTDAHRQMGLKTAELNRLVELLQQAMRENRVPFAAQNRFLAKLAPMKRDGVTR